MSSLAATPYTAHIHNLPLLFSSFLDLDWMVKITLTFYVTLDIILGVPCIMDIF